MVDVIDHCVIECSLTSFAHNGLHDPNCAKESLFIRQASDIKRTFCERQLAS